MNNSTGKIQAFNIICPHCGNNGEIAYLFRFPPLVSYHYMEDGLDIIIPNIYNIICEKCSQYFREITNFKILHEKLAKAIILNPSKLTGKELCFLRKELELNLSAFSFIISNFPAQVTVKTQKQMENEEISIPLDISQRIKQDCSLILFKKWPHNLL